MRRVLLTLLLAGLFLLMLSALVVTPETADAQPVMDTARDFHAIFQPLISAILPGAADIPSSHPDLRLTLCLLPVLLLCAALLAGGHDANGHVLTAARYENSVYQLFRPEVAGG